MVIGISSASSNIIGTRNNAQTSTFLNNNSRTSDAMTTSGTSLAQAGSLDKNYESSNMKNSILTKQAMPNKVRKKKLPTKK